MPITKFEPNAPIEVVLKFPSGKHVTSQKFGTEQVMYSFTDGSIGYVPLIVEKKLAELNVKAGQPIEICKAKIGSKTEWQVKRVEAPSNAPGKPQGVSKILDGAADLQEPYADEAPIQTRLEDALRTALDAATKAEKFSQEIGHPVVFDKNDIRLMATTLVINGRRAA